MKHFIFFTTFLLLSTLSSYAGSKYSLETELPTFKLSYDEFWDIIDKIKPLINKFDKTFYKADIYFILSDGKTNETIDNPKKTSPISLKKAYNLMYITINSGGAISRLEIHFSDYKRTISVSGTNILEIQSVIDNLKRLFSNHRSIISGPTFRLISWFILIICSIILSYTFTIKEGVLRIRNREGWSNYIGTLIFLFAISASWGLYDLEFLFPGFSIYNEDISFISKYSEHFTFWGFTISIIGLGYTILRKNKAANKS